MNKFKKHFEEPVFVWIWIFIVIIVILSLYTNIVSYQKSKYEQEQINLEIQARILAEEELRLAEEKRLLEMSGETDVPIPSLSVNNENCNFNSLGDYQVIDIFQNPKATPFNIDYKNYTNRFEITGKIEDAFLCILSDVDNAYSGKGAYRFTTFIWMGDESVSGHINVLSMPNNGMLYDRTSDPTSPTFDGKFYGSQTPFRYYLNLKSVKVADRDNGGFKYINPLKQLQRQGEMRIGGFVNDSPHKGVGKILNFRIFYKGGLIKPIGDLK